MNPLLLLRWFARLPLAFSLPFTALSLWWMFSGFRELNDHVATPLVGWLAGLAHGLMPAWAEAPSANFGVFFNALVVVVLFALGFGAAYNLSALANWLLLSARLKGGGLKLGNPVAPPAPTSEQGPFAGYRKIGLVLAGGGAKGAFQAGAMKAIYRFLAAHNALHKVKVVSGTSIGSWNALFWLADLIESAGGAAGAHERWWRAISLKALAAPAWYVPFLRNAFLSAEPWRRMFDHIFGRGALGTHLARSGVHFYLTRSNVQSGQLTCTTNNPHPPAIEKVTYEVVSAAHGTATFLEGLKAGVFASMDLPPLFPYVRRDGGTFEDGGVLDNLPILFPANDGCDLIFILPLNADFEAVPNERSILARLFRVMDVRQGALERAGFKLIYLYNELARLRDYCRAHPGPAGEALPEALRYTLARTNQVISVFAVCPAKSFVQQTISTVQLWKKKEAGVAFEVMERATSELLPGFGFGQPQPSIKVAIVDAEGRVVWDERF
jgi:NTE family protein